MEAWNLPVMLYRLALESALWRPVPGLGEDAAGLEWLSPAQALLPQGNTAGLLPTGGGEPAAREEMPVSGAVLPPGMKNRLPEEAALPFAVTAGQGALPQPEEDNAQVMLSWPEPGRAEPWKLPGEPEGGSVMDAAERTAAAALGSGGLSPVSGILPDLWGQEAASWIPASFQAGELGTAAPSQQLVGERPFETGPSSSSGEILLRLLREGARPQNQPVRVTTQAPVIQVTGQNTGNTAADRMRLTQAIRDVLLEQINGSAARPGARIW